MIHDENVVFLRLERSRFTDPVKTKADYDELFRMMSPVPTDYWIRPGTAPCLEHRAAFDDVAYNDRLRSNRRIVKGRFQKHGIAYVRFDELPLFAAIYKKEMDRIGPLERKILDLFEHEGPMSIGTIKEITGMYVKDITPVLHKLQSAFLVFEDQRDDDWQRSWFLMQNEFPELDLGAWKEEDALDEVFTRFVTMNVFADAAMGQAFFDVPLKTAVAAFARLAERGTVVSARFEGREGYVLKSDLEMLEGPVQSVPHTVFAINRNDFLVRSNGHLLKEGVGSVARGIMYHLLIDGRFQGVVEGGFKFGPHVVENVRVDLPVEEAEARRAEILKAVGKVLDPEASPAQKYNGVAIKR